MKKALSAILSVLIVLGSVFACTPALASAIDGAKKYTVIAEFETSPLSERFAGKGFPSAAQNSAMLKKLNIERAAPLAQMAKAVSGFKIRNSFTNLINGVSFTATKSEMQAVKAIKGVKSVYEVPKIKGIEVTPAAEPLSSGSMIGVDTLHDMGYNGEGTAIAIIDGGFNYNHEAMTLQNPSAAKYSKDDIENIISSNEMAFEDMSADDVYKSAKVPFAFDYLEGDSELDDENNSDPNHGTHVSGIAAGNGGNVLGVAPEAQVLMFKIDVYEEEAFLDNMLCAVDDAAKFDISSINLSVGMSNEIIYAPAYELLSEAFDRARERGILICCAAGNEGMFSNSVDCPDYSTDGIPNGFPAATSIASVDNVNLSQKIKSDYLISFIDSNGKEYSVSDYGYYYSSPFPEEAEVVAINANGISTPKYDLEGKIALICEHNAVSPSTQKKYLKILEAGNPAAVILTYELYAFGYELYYDYGLPVAIMEADAYALLHALPTKVSPVFEEYYAEPASVLEASFYTSCGLSDDLKMTVDVAAPGGIIYSSVANGYSVYSGTSMAAPHITGAAALLDQYLAAEYPSITGKAKADLKENLLMSTADPVIYNGCAVSPKILGAGLVNLEEAIRTNAVLTDENGGGALNIGEIQGNEFTLNFKVKNFSAVPVTYDTVSFDVITDKATAEKEFDSETGEYITSQYLTGESRKLGFEISSCTLTEPLTVQAGETAEVSATLTLDSDELAENAEIFTNGFFIEGFAYLTDSSAAETPLNMPFLGFSGDWFNSPALSLDEDYFDFYALKSIKSLLLELVDSNGETVFSNDEEYIRKGDLNSCSGIIFENVDVEIPDGKYTVRLTATLANPGGEDKTQVFTFEKLYRIDRTEPEIIKLSSKKNSDGTYEVTILANCDDIMLLEAYGARVGNRRFYDIYEFEAPDEVTDEGFIYKINSLSQNPASLCFEITDAEYNYSYYGSISFLASLILSIENFFNTLFMILQGL